MLNQLDPRSARVFDIVARKFIDSGNPVSSKTVAEELPELISSATVRNIMAGLEALGLLRQPHTSAGRTPTALGYKVYVRRLVQQGKLRPVDENWVKQKLYAAHLELAGLLQRACSLLSEMSNHVGVVLVPPPADTIIRHIEFVRLGSGRILVVFITRGGMVHTRAIGLEDDFSEGDLQGAAQCLLERFCGLTLGDVRERILEMASSISGAVDPRLRLALLLGERWLGPGIDGAEVLVEGASRLLDSPELADADALQALFATFEERTELSQVLNECGAGRRPRVLIGAERLPAALGNCTLVAAGYGGAGEQPVGAMGVLGPTRMEYARAIPVVSVMARATSEMITELNP
ncbi:MAG: heat-inducible transcriptional repressor HrcA [Acidobacteriota bacterium]